MQEDSKEERERTESALCFDGEDGAKWEAWEFKMMAHAGKKGHEEAFVTDYKLNADASKWSDKDKENSKLMKAAWAQLAFVVCGHVMRSVMDVKSKDPREAWEKLTKEFLPNEILDVKDVLEAFQKIKFGTNSKANPTNWIEALVRNNAQVTAINKKHQKDDFLLLTHVFAELPAEEHETHMSKHTNNTELMSVIEANKTATAHWKRFVKSKDDEDTEKTGDVFHGEGSKTSCPGPNAPKKHPTAKKRFKGDCRKCGKQGHKAADCCSGGGDKKSNGGGGDKNKDVTCHECGNKGHFARECPNKKKNECGLFCGMICQEALDGSKEEEDDAGSEERSFVGMAALVASNSDAESDDDSCPSLLARAPPNTESRNDTDDDSDDNSMPKLVGRKHHESDSDAEFDDDGDSIPGLIKRRDIDSDSDCDSENEESKDDSMPDLFSRHCCYDSDSDAGSKLREDEAVCNLSEDADISLASSEVMVKWLLDAGASIHAGIDGKNVEDEKPCNESVAVNVADGDTVAPRGVRRKVVRDTITKCPLLIRNSHLIPEFSKRVLSVSKLIDDGYQVELLVEPMGLDAVEVTEPLKTNKVGFHIIPDDSDSKAGRKKPGEPSVDASKSNEASTAATAADVTAEASNHKAMKLERELKKLDSSWNPIDKTATDAPIVIETEDNGKEKATEVCFVFNTELMNEPEDLQGSHGKA